MSSSEDENIEWLKEAIDTNFISDDLYQQNSQTKTTTNTAKLPSLRRKDDDYDKQYDNLGVTKGFQQHVAKHLIVKLDEMLKNKIKYESKEYKAKKRKGGIKLFSNSATCIKKLKEEQIIINKKIIHEHEASLEEIKTVAVTSEEILSKKQTLYWSNRSKAKIFLYKNINGILNEIQ